MATPQSLEEALGLLADDDGARPIGGGVALVLLLKSGFAEPGRFVSLAGVHELHGIRADIDGALYFGAMTRLRDIELSPDVRSCTPVLAETLACLAPVRIRNMATLGGHLAHADPHQDLPPVLLALDTEVHIAGPRGHYWKPLDNLLNGYYETTLGPGEIVTGVRIPAAQPGSRSHYAKTTARTVEDWPAAGVAVHTSRQNGRISAAAVAVGAVTVRAERRRRAESMLVGQVPTSELLDECAEAAAADLAYTTDQFGSAEFKRHIVRVHTRRSLQEVLGPT